MLRIERMLGQRQQLQLQQLQQLQQQLQWLFGGVDEPIERRLGADVQE